MRSVPARQPAWILYRSLDEFPIADSVVLQRWAERGRIEPDDYLLNPRADTCLQAKEISELKAIFHKAAVRRFEKISCAFALGTFAILCLRVVAG